MRAYLLESDTYQADASVLARSQHEGPELLAGDVAAVVLLDDGRPVVELLQLSLERVTMPLLQEDLPTYNHRLDIRPGLNAQLRGL